MKYLRIFLWFSVAVTAALAGFAYLNGGSLRNPSEQSSVYIGGPFNLVNHRGEVVNESILSGRRHAMFFGFTNCPDVCPTTLMDAAGWLKQLGKDAENVDFYFVTVDPQRDTPVILNEYVNAFDPRITGLTGDTKQIEQTLRSYKVYAKRVELEDDEYTMDHSAQVMLFRSDGTFQGTISYNENPDTAIKKLRLLIENG